MGALEYFSLFALRFNFFCHLFCVEYPFAKIYPKILQYDGLYCLFFLNFSFKLYYYYFLSL